MHILQVERMLGMAAMGMKMILTKASKKIGKFMLRSCRAELKDVGQVHRIDKLLEQHHLGQYADSDQEESSDESEAIVPNPMPPTFDDAHTIGTDTWL